MKYGKKHTDGSRSGGQPIEPKLLAEQEAVSAPVVTQADRDAAGQIFGGECVGPAALEVAAEYFARHRTAAEAASKALVAELVEALDVAVAASDVFLDGGDMQAIEAFEVWLPKARAILARTGEA